MHVETASARTILTPTGGFLRGFTHTLNPYRGCAFGSALCGVYCYAPESRPGADWGRPWGSYLFPKEQAAALYRDDARRLRNAGKPLRLFMSSVTDPYVPHERRLRVTRSLLAAMIEQPPDLLVLQTHTPGPVMDLDVLRVLGERSRLVVQITVETDLSRVPGLPPHATPLEARIDALQKLRAHGVATVAVVAPLLPVRDERRFAETLGACADAVVLDHYLLGDGSPNGTRTRRPRAHAPLPLPEALIAAGFEEWTRLERFDQVVAVFREVLGPARVALSEEGFRRTCHDPSWPLPA